MSKGSKYHNEPEYQLLLDIITNHLAGNAIELDFIHLNVDWSRVIDIALQQGVFPLCFHQILQTSWKFIPPEMINKINTTLDAAKQKCVRLTWKLIECINLLESNGVETIALKGSVLALQAYGDLYLRQFSDLDILIQSKDFPKAYNLLLMSGYRADFILEKFHQKYLIWSDNHFSFTKQGDSLELHWKIAPHENIHSLPAEIMWKDMQSAQIFDQSIRTLSLENTLLLICLHGAKHGWNQLKWIVDLAYLATSITADRWTTILADAKRLGFSRQLCLGLYLIVDLVKVELPPQLLYQIIRDRQVQMLASQVKENLYRTQKQLSQFGMYYFYLKSRERLPDKIHFLIDIVFIPKTPDWRAISLPENLYFLYYLIRPFRWLIFTVKSRAAK